MREKFRNLPFLFQKKNSSQKNFSTFQIVSKFLPILLFTKGCTIVRVRTGQRPDPGQCCRRIQGNILHQTCFGLSSSNHDNIHCFHQVGQDKMNELTETQVKLSLATQEISSLKAALQTSNRQREQVMACYRDY